MPSTDLRAKGQIWPTTTRATAPGWPPWPRWPSPGHVGVAIKWTCWSRRRRHQRQPHGLGRRQERGLQISGRRDDMTLRALFNEELGAVLQIRTADRAAVLQTLREHGCPPAATSSARRAPPRPRSMRARANCRLARCQVRLRRLAQRPAPGLDAVSWKIAQQRDNPACADSEHAAAGEPADPGMHLHLTFDPAENPAAPFLNWARAPAWPCCASRA